MADFINVDANLFRAAAVCQSDEEVRYYINGVYVTRHPQGGAVLVSTDGHRLFVALDQNGRVGAAKIIRLGSQGLKACVARKGDDVRRLVIDKAGNAEIVNVWKSEKSTFVDGTYPDWRKVVPVQKWKNAPASFNGKYLGSFGRIAAMLTEDSTSIRVLTGSDGSSPALVLFPYFDAAFGILMPMRSPEPEGLPAWMRPVMNRAKPKANVPPKKKTPKQKRKARK
jgi:hypothetical protein